MQQCVPGVWGMVGGRLDAVCGRDTKSHSIVYVDNYYSFGYLSILQIPSRRESQLDVNVFNISLKFVNLP